MTARCTVPLETLDWCISKLRGTYANLITKDNSGEVTLEDDAQDVAQVIQCLDHARTRVIFHSEK